MYDRLKEMKSGLDNPLCGTSASLMGCEKWTYVPLTSSGFSSLLICPQTVANISQIRKLGGEKENISLKES